MVEGHGREQWAHTSLICALIANAHRDPKKQRPFKPDDFNSYVDPRNRHERRTDGDVVEVNSETVSVMRAAFTGRSQNASSQ
jgi:hypothetical protein